jgi:hypothetical protein
MLPLEREEWLMTKRRIGAFLVAGALLATVAMAEESTRPPTNLKKVGDHWTPWDPPEAGPDDYIIVKGDTLWDLAEKWLGDPYLWPQIWDENRYILDSHWIYPGDPLVVPGRPTVVPPGGPPPTGEGEGEGEGTGEGEGAGEGEGEGEGAEPGPGEGDPTALTPTPIPEPAPLLPVADAHDVYCSGYIDPDDDVSEVWIAGHELEKIGMGQGDVIYLNQGRLAGIEPGSEWGIQRHTRRVNHPVTNAEMGVYVRRLGRVRVMAVQDETSIAVIDFACEDIHDSDELVPWSEIPIPRMTEMPEFDRYAVDPSGNAAGYIVAFSDPVDAVGQGHVIHVDLGADTGLGPGDVLTLFRDNADLPRLLLGQAVVLTVESGSATVRITDSVRESGIGDNVEIR